jgi:hypothetical protein
MRPLEVDCTNLTLHQRQWPCECPPRSDACQMQRSLWQQLVSMHTLCQSPGMCHRMNIEAVCVCVCASRLSQDLQGQLMCGATACLEGCQSACVWYQQLPAL